MIGIAIIIALAFYLSFLWPIFLSRRAEAPRSARYDMQMKKLWSAAQTSMRDHKPLRAEKALLTILKFDEKNAAAYNRLGILYAKEQKFDEAIECFEIAQSLDNNPSSLHNVGLIYLETGAYEKAVMAFEQAINIENDIPARFIALAKAHERLGQTKAAIDALENAYALDHSTNTLRQILAIYEMTGDAEALAATTARIEAQMAANAKAKAAKARPGARRAGKVTTKMPSASRSTAKSNATAARRVSSAGNISARASAGSIAATSRVGNVNARSLKASGGRIAANHAGSATAARSGVARNTNAARSGTNSTANSTATRHARRKQI